MSIGALRRVEQLRLASSSCSIPASSDRGGDEAVVLQAILDIANGVEEDVGGGLQDMTVRGGGIKIWF